jgi:hypothetical protein
MRQLTTDHLMALLTDHAPPCISLYQPTHRHHPDNQQDPIRYGNLLREMEKSLREKFSTREVRDLVGQYQVLVDDREFWNHRTDGLAILGAPDRFQLFELQRPVKELLVVAGSFHVKPLLRILQSADRFQILCLTRQEAKLYEGNRDVLDEVELTDVPASLTEALGEQLTEPHQSVRSVTGQASMYHGTGQKKDEVQIDMERFFRVIDRAILEHHSRPSGLPLMLAALPEYHTPFREISHNPFLMAEGLQVNPEALSVEQLRTQAWQAMLPIYLERLGKLVDEYQSSKAGGLGSDDLGQVVQAAIAGRVGTLLVEADRVISGRIDTATGEIKHHDLSHPEIGDVLDDLAEMVLRMKGTVVVVPAERMPSTTGLAATYRF